MMRTVAAALFAVASAASDEAKLDKVNHELNLEMKVMAENWVKSVAQKQLLTAKGNGNRYSVFAEDMYKLRAIVEKLPEMKKDRDAREAKLKEFYEVAVPQVLKDAEKDILKLQTATKTTTSKAKAKAKGKAKADATPTDSAANGFARGNKEVFFKAMELVKTYEGFRNFANWMDWERNPELKLEVLANLKFADLYPLYQLEHGLVDSVAAKKLAYDLLDFLGHPGKIDGTLDDTDKTFKAPEKKITFEEMRARVTFMKNTYLPEAAAVNEKEAKAMRKEMNTLWKVWGEKNGVKPNAKSAVHPNAVQAIKNDADKVNIYNLMRNNPFRLEGDTTTGTATPTEKDCKDGKCGHDHKKEDKKDGEQDEQKDGMSGCAIGMIVVGVLAVLALGALAVSMLCCKADEDAMDSV